METPEEKKQEIEKVFVVANKLGLHARPAALFVQTANRFDCDIEVTKEGETVNGKSIMGIMTLAAESGSEINIRFSGADANEAFKALTELFESNFGE